MKSQAIFSIVVIFYVAVSFCSSQQVTIIGPRTLPNTSDKYKALIDVQRLRSNEKLVVALRSKNNFYGKQKFESVENFNREIEFELPTDRHDYYNIMALVLRRNDGKSICLRREVPVYSSKASSSITLIQTDKSVYKPGDKVRFRVLVLDHETKPYKFKSLNIKVLDNEAKATKTFTETQPGAFSMYENSFTLPEEPGLGKWRLDVTVDEANRKSSKTFLVKDFTPPPFKLYIETAPRVAFETYNSKIEMKIYAKYPFDTMVKGTADINAKVYHFSKPGNILSEKSRQVKIESGTEIIEFDLRKDLGISIASTNLIVEFSVNFIEDGSSRSASQSEKVEVVSTGRNVIRLDKAEGFKPGFSYKIEASVYTLDGELEPSISSPLQMRLTYGYKNKKATDDELISEDAFLKNGKATYVLNPAEDALNFTVEFKFLNSMVKEFITPVKSNFRNTEFMQVTYDVESSTRGKTVNIKAESNGLIPSLSVVVIGAGGLVYSKNYPQAANKNSYEFKFKVTQEMTPEASVIVFYVREQDGNIVSDQFTLQLGFKETNLLSIKPRADSFKPKETATFDIKTQANSLIALLAVDQSIQFLGTNNEITKDEVNSKLSSINKFKIGEASDFSISNAAVLQISTGKWHECYNWEESFFKLGNLEVITIPDEDEEVEALEEDFESFEAIDPAENLLRKYFPDVWIYETVEANMENSKFSQVVPDTITTWSVSGFSINPDFGLAIAEPQKIRVFQDFFIKVGIPSSVKIGEVFKIDATVFNYLDKKQNVQLSFEVDNKELEIVKEEKMYGKPAGCFEYGKDFGSRSRSLNIDTKSLGSHTILARALKSGNFKIKIEAFAKDATDVVEKIVKVDYEGVTQFKSTPMLVDLRRSAQFIEDVSIDLPNDVEPATIKIEASISGNIMGPALENIDRFITIKPEACGEQKMKNFALSIYAYKYLKSNKLANATVTDNALEAIMNGYQSVKSRQSLSGGFKVWSEGQKNVDGTWLTAYASQLLGDASELVEIDDKVAKNTLEYLRTKQVNKYFEDDADNPRAKQGKPEQRRVYLTAFVMIAVAKNVKLYDDYAYIANDGADYIKKQYGLADYEKAIVAYAFSLNYETDAAERLINSMTNNFLNIRDVKAIQVEIASYKILACLKLGKEAQAIEAFEWLIKQRSPSGGFFSTHDTVVGLQAISAMAEHFSDINPSINIEIAGSRVRQVTSERIQSSIDSKLIELPSNERRFTVSANGRGLAYINVFAEYKLRSNEKKGLDVTFDAVETEGGVKLEVKVRTNVVTNMGIIEVELPSGYEYKKHKVTEDVKKVEINSDNNQVVLYLDKIQPSLSSKVQIIEATKLYDVKQPKKAAIRAYDYYEPGAVKTTIFYDLAKELQCGNLGSRFNDVERYAPITTTTRKYWGK